MLNPSHYANLRSFIAALESSSELKRICIPIDPYLEVTELCQRTLRSGGPALLFETPQGSDIPLLGNLFGTVGRVAKAIGANTPAKLREIGQMLASLKSPEMPNRLGTALATLPTFAKLANVNPRIVKQAAFQTNVIEEAEIDLSELPIQTCWPDDAGPLISFGLVITKGPHKDRQNIGIYRQQVIAKNKVIMRWLAHRGGAIDFQEWRERHPGKPFPVVVVIGADPATLLAAVTPIPDTLSEFQFAGLLRGAKTEVIESPTSGLYVPASAEFVLEGTIDPEETALEGPFGDHTGYYNAVDRFPVFTIKRMSQRDNPIYHSTYMGRAPHDEPSILAMALNEVFVPILQKQFPEIIDFYLPPEGCSYRIAVVSINKRYPGHARRIMMGIWSYLQQFTYTKFVIITDADIDVRSWSEVIWAITTRMDPARDVLLIENTPVDYLDFASPTAGLGSKMGFDATNKWQAESTRNWGRPIEMSADVKRRVDELCTQLQC